MSVFQASTVLIWSIIHLFCHKNKIIYRQASKFFCFISKRSVEYIYDLIETCTKLVCDCDVWSVCETFADFITSAAFPPRELSSDTRNCWRLSVLFYPLKIRACRVVPSKSTGTVLGVGLVALNTSDWLITHSIFLFEPPFLKKSAAARKFLCDECVCSCWVLFWFWGKWVGSTSLYSQRRWIVLWTRE